MSAQVTFFRPKSVERSDFNNDIGIYSSLKINLEGNSFFNIYLDEDDLDVIVELIKNLKEIEKFVQTGE